MQVGVQLATALGLGQLLTPRLGMAAVYGESMVAVYGESMVAVCGESIAAVNGESMVAVSEATLGGTWLAPRAAAFERAWAIAVEQCLGHRRSRSYPLLLYQ